MNVYKDTTQPIEALELPPRIFNVLKRAGMNTIAEVTEKSLGELRMLRGMKADDLGALSTALTSYSAEAGSEAKEDEAQAKGELEETLARTVSALIGVSREELSGKMVQIIVGNDGGCGCCDDCGDCGDNENGGIPSDVLDALGNVVLELFLQDANLMAKIKALSTLHEIPMFYLLDKLPHVAAVEIPSCFELADAETVDIFASQVEETDFATHVLSILNRWGEDVAVAESAVTFGCPNCCGCENCDN